VAQKKHQKKKLTQKQLGLEDQQIKELQTLLSEYGWLQEEIYEKIQLLLKKK